MVRERWTPPPSPKKRRRARKRTAWRRGLGIVGFCVAIFFGIPLFLHLRARQRDKEGPGALAMARLGRLADGRAVVLVVETVVHQDSEGPDMETTRMDVIDATTGARIVRKPRMDVRDCIPSSSGLAWCIGRREKSRLSVYDLATLEVVRSEDDVESNVPALKKGMHDEPQVDREEGAAIVMTNDAAIWSIASAGCRTACVAKEVPKKKEKLETFFSNRGYGATASTLFGEVKLADGREIGFTGDPKKSLTIGRADDKKPLAQATFLKPGLLVMKEKADDSGMFRVGAAEIFIVAHDDTLDEKTAKKSLSAFDLEGRTKWTQQIGGGSFEHGFRVGDAIVIAVDAGEAGYVFALSLEDGRILWRQPT